MPRPAVELERPGQRLSSSSGLGGLRVTIIAVVFPPSTPHNIFISMRPRKADAGGRFGVIAGPSDRRRAINAHGGGGGGLLASQPPCYTGRVRRDVTVLVVVVVAAAVDPDGNGTRRRALDTIINV